jgi:hypothetical protein
MVSAVIVSIIVTSCVSTRKRAELSEDQRLLPDEGPTSIYDAVRDGYTNLQKNIPTKCRVVVLGFTGNDVNEATWASDELTHILVNAKRHTVIDRRGLGVELTEKKITGEIEEASARDIGYLLGAEMILYGNISHYSNRISFLSLKVMDIRSGDIVAITSERFTVNG